LEGSIAEDDGRPAQNSLTGQLAVFEASSAGDRRGRALLGRSGSSGYDAGVVLAGRGVGSRCRGVAVDGGRHEPGHPLHLRTELVERLEEVVAALGARDAGLRVEDEERHTVDAEAPGARLVRAHLVGEGVTREHLAHGLAVEAGVDGQAFERVGAAQVLAAGLVGVHEYLEQSFLRPHAGSVVGEAMGDEGVGLPRQVQVELEPGGGGFARRAGQHAGGFLAVDAVLVLEFVDRQTRLFLGCVRIEFETAPYDLDVVGVFVLSQGMLEAALADVAPGAGDVGEDLYSHGRQIPSGRRARGESTTCRTTNIADRKSTRLNSSHVKISYA